MRTYEPLPHTISVKLGVALSAVAILLLLAASSARADLPLSGGLVYDDPTAPTIASDGSTLAADRDGLVNRPLDVHGTITGTGPGDALVFQRLDRRDGWITEATTTVAPDGTYAATWTSRRAGRTTVRVLPAAHADVRAADTALTREVTLYRPGVATWYGPGFYGRRTACGVRLSRTLMGVAHKTLPCGTPVAFLHEGRTITVPVVDRGPFRRGTSWDLTAAAAKAIGMSTTTTLGAVRVAR